MMDKYELLSDMELFEELDAIVKESGEIAFNALIGKAMSKLKGKADGKKIVEMLEIAFFSGYISEMNFSVLKTEFDLFINEIAGFEGVQKTISQNSLKVISFPNSLFNKSTIWLEKSS